MGSGKLRSSRKIRAARIFVQCTNFRVARIFVLCKISRMHEIRTVREITPALLASCTGFVHFARGESTSPVK